MKFVRYRYGGNTCSGILEDDRIHEVEGDMYFAYAKTGNRVRVDEAELLAPVRPGKMIGLSNVNYYTRRDRLNLPHPEQILFFIKPPNTISGPNMPIELPGYIRKAAHELELTIVIGKKGKYIPVEQADSFIFGYTLANDITIRDFMVPNMPVGKAKSLDTITPLGPCIETEVDLDTINYRMYVSGQLRHDVYANDLIFQPARIVSELSQLMTLEPGDIIMTGAPCNNIEFQIGDMIEMKCEQIGSMANPVVGI